MTQYNQASFIAGSWAANFTTMVNALRTELSVYNAALPIVLGVQRVAGRNRVYPYIGLVKQQQQSLVLPNLLKAQMEVRTIMAASRASSVMMPAIAL